MDLSNVQHTSTPDLGNEPSTEKSDETLETVKFDNDSPELEEPTNEKGFVIACLKPSQFKYLTNAMQVEDHFFVEQDIPNLAEKFSRLKKSLLNPPRNDFFKRLSGVSSLSSSSSGHYGDISSGISSSSASSKRDR